MTVKERILTIRLLEKIKQQEAFARKIKIVAKEKKP